MIVRRAGGMTEFIPSPQEKRGGLVRDHALELIENLHTRLKRLEGALGLPLREALQFDELLARIKQEEDQARKLNEELLAVGITHGEEIET